MAKTIKRESTTATELHLLQELSQLIEESKGQVAVHANSMVTILFWNVGKRINQEILQNKRADYGKRIVSTLSAQLEIRYGKNFTEKNVRRMLQFAEQFQDNSIVVTLSRQLSWSHFVELLPLKNYDAKLYYAKTSAIQILGVRDLRKQIASKALERSTISCSQLA